MAAALAAVPDPVVDFLVAHGDGAWSDVNVAQAGGDVAILLSQQHWLHIASGGAAQVPFRQLEMAFCAALYVEAPAVAGLRVAHSAVSPVRMAGVLPLQSLLASLLIRREALRQL